MQPNAHREDTPEILLNLVDHLDAMVAYWDTNQICVFANNAYQTWFGKTREQLIGMTMQELLGPIYPKNLPYIQGALNGQKQVFEREIPIPDGSIRHSLATYIPDIAGDHVRGFFVLVADVTPLKKLEQELRAAKTKAEYLAMHDFLTGLPNRVLLMDRINQGLALAKRKSKVAAVLSLDLDDFKQVNDTYGHGAGDQLLIEIAMRIKNTLRETDTAARLGGDEFLLLTPEITSNAEIEALAKRLLEKIRQPVQLGDTLISPSCSVGIALYPQHGESADALIANSDHALYAAKKLGKNRYTIFHDEKKSQES